MRYLPDAKKTVYVFGHKNPDTDSTCAAITYAWLKNQLDSDKEYIPAVLGNINSETSFCLEYFGINMPIKLESLKPRVADMRLERIQPVHEQDSILEVVQKIVTTSGKTLPVADDKGRLMGIISITDLVPALISSQQNQFKELVIPVSNLLHVLELSKIQGHLEDDVFRGNVYVFSDLTYYSRIAKNGLIICNRHEFGTGFMFSLEPKYIIVADVEDNSAIEPIKDYKGVIFTSRKNIYDLVQAVNLALPVSNLIKKENLEYYALSEEIEDVRKNMITSKYRSYPVVNEHGKIVGMFSRSNLMDVSPKEVILVDHNEKGQSIDGIETNKILEVIDHHRISDFQTMGPLFYRAEPVGSTNTIICKMYLENGIEIPKPMAGLMLSGILSDTLIFKSPTCTPEDKRLAEHLAEIAGVNIQKYGIRMLSKGESLEGIPPRTIITRDMKKFIMGNYKVSVSQVNVGDIEAYKEILGHMKAELESVCNDNNLDLSVLMLTSLVMGGTELIVAGEEKWLAQAAFNMEKGKDDVFIKGMFSRKKQVVPKLMAMAYT
ncbi:MAG: putative manganese-dependent inorganic diphosphatase [Caldicoprobacterales bacterium]|jgi:manganese-dependent inorganic pyrophosphatase|nr:putative manganese-dependent inorganic diphosphatase [Clostridiales bacterium]